jgi:hypothetical protein
VSEATIAALPLDAVGHVPWRSEPRVTLHRVAVHVTAETHRHAGHADIVRELIDGTVGMRRTGDNMASDDPAWWAGYRNRLERLARDAAGDQGCAFRRRIPLNPSVLDTTASQKGHSRGSTRSSMPASSWSAKRSPTGSGGPSGRTGTSATWALGSGSPSRRAGSGSSNGRNGAAESRYANRRTERIRSSQAYSTACTRGAPDGPMMRATSEPAELAVGHVSTRGHCRGNQ